MANCSERGTLRRLGAVALGLAAFCVVGLDAAPAQAAPDILRPGTHPWWFAGGIGPSFGVTGRSGRYYAGHYPSQFTFTEEIGGHFSGEFEGPALGAHFQQGLGNHFFRSTIGLRFWYDIQIIDDLGLYIAPDAQLGWTYVDVADQNFINVQFGAAGRLILGDRGMVFARVVCFDFNINDNYWWMNYNLILGGGVTW